MKTLKLHGMDIGKGSLILVNPSHPLRYEPGEESMVPVHPAAAHVRLERQAARMLAEVISLFGYGHPIVPISGFRTMEEQRVIYADSLRRHGKEFTRKYVAIPGCSEHQTGLAVDLAENKENIDFIRPDFPYTGICQSFRKKSIQYGFIQRYPAGQEAITRIAHEPWHFRYVGYPHSELMREKDLTLEEYTTYLKQFPYHRGHLRVRYNRQDFEIFFIPLQPDRLVEIEIPEQTPFQLSGNNEDGMVITLWRNLI